MFSLQLFLHLIYTRLKSQPKLHKIKLYEDLSKIIRAHDEPKT